VPIWIVCRASYIDRRLLFGRSPDFGASFQVAESLLGVGQVSLVLMRSVLLSIRIVSSLVLINKQGSCSA